MKAAVYSALVVLWWAQALPAQTRLVIPTGLENREGNAASWVPSKYNLSRVQYLYHSSVMPNQNAAIRAFRLRRDGTSSFAFMAYTQEVEVSMANLPREPVAGYSMVWEDNRLGDFTCVLQKTTVSYPVVGPVTTPPATFTGSVRFLLDKPFQYLQGSPFLVEFTTHAANLTVVEWLADAEEYGGWTGAPSGGSRTYSGQGCPGTFNNYGEIPHIGGRWHHYGYCQTTGRALAGINLIGVDSTALGAIPLPFDLAPLGGAGCHLYVAPLLYIPGRVEASTPTGRINFELGFIPNDLALVGARYYEQIIVEDSGFNTLGIRASRLASCTVGSGFSGTVSGFQFLAYSPVYRLTYPWATWYSPKVLVMELEL